VLSNGPIDTKIDTKLLAGRSKNGSSVYADFIHRCIPTAEGWQL
jgi:hypothetical protein